MNQALTQIQGPLTLREAAYRTLKIMGTSVLNDSSRFTSCVLDLMADDSSITNVLERNCDDALLRFYWPVLQNGTESMLDDCMYRAAEYLEHDRMLQQEVSKQIAAELGFAIGLYLRVPCSDMLRMAATGIKSKKESDTHAKSSSESSANVKDSKDGEDTLISGNSVIAGVATIGNASGSSVKASDSQTANHAKTSNSAPVVNGTATSADKNSIHKYLSIGAGLLCLVCMVSSYYNQYIYNEDRLTDSFMGMSNYIFLFGNFLVFFMFIIAFINNFRRRSLLVSYLAIVGSFAILIVPLWSYAEWIIESNMGMFRDWPSDNFESLLYINTFLALISLVYFAVYAYRCKLLLNSQP